MFSRRSNYHSDFDRDFSRKFNFVFDLSLLVYIVAFTAIVFGGYMLISHPHEIGAFFGKIVSGFNSAQ